MDITLKNETYMYMHDIGTNTREIRTTTQTTILSVS
jgi:hypothetical protein